MRRAGSSRASQSVEGFQQGSHGYLALGLFGGVGAQGVERVVDGLVQPMPVVGRTRLQARFGTVKECVQRAWSTLTMR